MIEAGSCPIGLAWSRRENDAVPIENIQVLRQALNEKRKIQNPCCRSWMKRMIERITIPTFHLAVSPLSRRDLVQIPVPNPSQRGSVIPFELDVTVAAPVSTMNHYSTAFPCHIAEGPCTRGCLDWAAGYTDRIDQLLQEIRPGRKARSSTHTSLKYVCVCARASGGRSIYPNATSFGTR